MIVWMWLCPQTDRPIQPPWIESCYEACLPGDSLAANMPRILVIDDNDTVRSTLCFLLRHAGFGVDEACNGQMGLEQAYRSPPDLILCDLTMPVMDGFETISRVRSDPVLRRIPITVISGSVSEADESRAKSLGANSFIGKPFSHRPLMNLVAAELRRSNPELTVAVEIAGNTR